ncbi:retrotransposon protein, putative, ty3-gypsy subclass [Tanacetum coccineum]
MANPSQDDVTRIMFGDDLKKAQDHSKDKRMRKQKITILKVQDIMVYELKTDVVVDKEILKDDLTALMISNQWERFAEIERIRFASGLCQSSRSVVALEHYSRGYSNSTGMIDTSYANPQRWADISMRDFQQASPKDGRPESITPADWDAQIAFWNDPRNQARAAQNRQKRAKSTVVCRPGSRSLARLRDEMMASSETREYPSLIDTFFVTHTVNGVFIRDEDRAIYEEMVRLRALGSNTESGVPYTDEEIFPWSKGQAAGAPSRCCLMSTPEFGSGSGGCGDDEIADDEDGGEDEEDGDS